MLHITYAASDAAVAERLRDDLTKAKLLLERDVLVVLVTPDALHDKEVTATIDKAIANQEAIVPVILADVALPAALADLPSVNLTKGYRSGPVIRAMRRAAFGPEVAASNRRLFFYLGFIVLVVFVIAMGSLATGTVAVPESEFATENAIREAQIESFTFPTLDPLMPRTTDDAIAFPQTVEAANTRNAPLLVATATALVENRQATETARSATQTAAAE